MQNKIMQGEEQKADQPGALGPKEVGGGEFPQYSFHLINPRLGGKEADNLKHLWAQTKKVSVTDSLPGQRTRKGQPGGQKT